MLPDRLQQASETDRPGRVSHLMLCLVLGVFASGCVALAVGAAGGVAGAVYVMGKLKDEVNHDVPTVHAATVAAMKDLDLTLSKDKADKVSAHLESEFADGKHVWIDLESMAEARTNLTIRVGITGDEARARKIHEAIKRHLPSSV
jgi:RNase adaptor protein for sRNA GlmZ degradation